MKLQQLQQRVVVAERQAAVACGTQVRDRRLLADKVRRRWWPRALVGAGIIIGFWLDGHSRRPPAEEAPKAKSAADHGPGEVAVWLGLAASALRLADRWGPLIEQALGIKPGSVAASRTAEQAADTQQQDLFQDAEPTDR